MEEDKVGRWGIKEWIARRDRQRTEDRKTGEGKKKGTT